MEILYWNIILKNYWNIIEIFNIEFLSQEKQNGLYLRQKNYDGLTGQFSAVNVEV